ncbi:epoxide hydrolase EphA [Streptomyces sodiiphilus]|uniref:Epoxide hydrolase EphA n=1 Tax=Streptomyces sodiiphilus TaxID=226217 RepID=A0ABN2NZ11_9ACTN
MRVDVHGVRLEVQVSGSGADVLLVHGYPDTHACWRYQVAALNAAGYRTIAPDLRGFGASDKPSGTGEYELSRHAADLLGVLDHMGVERVHLVGHDWGSVLVQLVAATAPHRVASVTCMSVGRPGSAMAAGLEQWQKSWYMLLFQFEGVAERWLAQDDFRHARQLLAGHPDREEVIERLRDPEELSSTLAIYRTGARPEQLTAPQAADGPSLPSPVMGIWSSGDPFLTEHSMTALGRHVNGQWRYERLEGPGHWMQLEAPDRVNELLLDFLAGAGGPSAPAR